MCKSGEVRAGGIKLELLLIIQDENIDGVTMSWNNSIASNDNNKDGKEPAVSLEGTCHPEGG